MTVEYQVGQRVCALRTFEQRDFDRFAALSGDDNPIHVDPLFSARTKFGRTVAHGMFLYSVVSSVLGSRLPGPGTVQVEQEMMFPNPTYTGEEVEIRLEVIGVHADRGLLELSTAVVRPDGNPGLQGRTLVRLPGQQARLLEPEDTPSPGPPTVTADLPFRGFCLGQRAQTRRTFSLADLREYADLSGDTNPIFADNGDARRQAWAGPMIPGALLGGLFSYLLGTELPGQGTNYLKQKLEFPAPAYPGQELEASVEIVRIRPDKQLVNLRTVCANPAREIVCQGEALVWISDVQER